MLSIQQIHDALINDVILPNFDSEVTACFRTNSGNQRRYTIAELDHPITKCFKLILNIINAVDELYNQGRWQYLRTLWSLSTEIREWADKIDLPLLEQLSLTLGLNVNFTGIIKRLRQAAQFDNEEIYSALSVFFSLP